MEKYTTEYLKKKKDLKLWLFHDYYSYHELKTLINF